MLIISDKYKEKRFVDILEIQILISRISLLFG